MKKGLTELVFILDRSGSMEGLEKDTIGGFNGMLEKQKKETGEANVTTIIFDDQIEVIHDRFPIEIVQPMTEKDYYVRGCTALLDAVGQTMEKIENIQNRLPDEMKAEKVIFIITTDGQENASQEYSAERIKKMIERNQENGWQFLFLGANIDAVTEAEKLGIRKSHAASYKNDSKGVQLNYQAATNILLYMRSMECDSDEMDLQISKLLKPIRDHLRRKS